MLLRGQGHEAGVAAVAFSELLDVQSVVMPLSNALVCVLFSALEARALASALAPDASSKWIVYGSVVIAAGLVGVCVAVPAASSWPVQNLVGQCVRCGDGCASPAAAAARGCARGEPACPIPPALTLSEALLFTFAFAAGSVHNDCYCRRTDLNQLFASAACPACTARRPNEHA